MILKANQEKSIDVEITNYLRSQFRNLKQFGAAALKARLARESEAQHERGQQPDRWSRCSCWRYRHR